MSMSKPPSGNPASSIVTLAASDVVLEVDVEVVDVVDAADEVVLGPLLAVLKVDEVVDELDVVEDEELLLDIT
jgi:hypothetical protein